jgi:DNA-binding NtrC family response regulator/ATP/maltotriose-dependent transcriptional regulator MalT
MAEADLFAFVDELVSHGKCIEAVGALQGRKGDLQRINLARFHSLLAELSLYTGDFSTATRSCERLLKEATTEHPRAVAHRILGEISANELNLEASLSHFTSARSIVEGLGPTILRPTIELSYWNWFLDVLPLETAHNEFVRVRRAVISYGGPAQFAELRLCAARVEARKGNLMEADRHWRVAQRLLSEWPHVKLQSQLWLNACMMSLLRGDARTALEHVDRAAAAADESGYFRARIGAEIDRAHVLCALGAFPDAKRSALAATQGSVSYPQLHVAALDCLGTIQISEGNIGEAEVTFDEVARRRPAHGTRLAPHWDVLSEVSSRLALAKARRGGDEAAELVSTGLKTAIKSEDNTWIVRMQLALSELRLRNGDVTGAAESLFAAMGGGRPSPEIIARTCALKGAVALTTGNVDVAVTEYGRGIRIATAIENVLLSSDLRRESPPGATHVTSITDATFLIELAGYPHVVAHEAYALLELTGAVESMALVARSDAGVRVVTTLHCTEGEAREAAASPGDRLVVACGSHRDEAWEIIAQLKPGLAERCNAIAVRKLVDTAVTLDRYRREEKQRAALWPPDTLETDGGLWISEQMTELLAIARRIATAPVSVLLTGETGTGKEVLARAIHRASGRGHKPFVPFNCTAVPRDMLESQLFGYRKGAFTGAHNAFDGVIRAAAGGTLFLDEIAEIGLDLQPKLLRFLETHEVHGLGDSHPATVDVRVVAATNADLESMVADGRFREDLFYRLNVVRLQLPPLRERREEIPPLVDHYLRTFAEQQKKGRLTLDDETLEYLVLFRWPGNVRQLVNEISRLVAYAEPDSTITPALLSPEVQASRRTVRVDSGDEPEIRVHLDQPLGDAIDAVERVMVVRALERAGGNYENAARLLGISRKGLFLKRRRWGMQRRVG